MSILSVDGVSIAFGGVRALDNVTASFGAGEIVGIIGPNGAGKTTLLNVICGLNRPDSGDIRFADRPIGGVKPNRIAGMGLARTFQSSQLFAGMSVLENMMTGLHLRSRANLFTAALCTGRMREEESELAARAREALDYVGFAGFADRPGNALSFGQRRIVEIARTLISDPKIVLLDEPAEPQPRRRAGPALAPHPRREGGDAGHDRTRDPPSDGRFGSCRRAQLRPEDRRRPA